MNKTERNVLLTKRTQNKSMESGKDGKKSKYRYCQSSCINISIDLSLLGKIGINSN